MKTKSGFTLAELLIVIVVIAIIAAITIVAYSGLQQRAQNSALEASTNSATKKLELYRVAHASYPTSITSCPSPGPSELCLTFSDNITVDYQQKTPGGSGYIIDIAHGYEMSAQSSGQFLYTSSAERTGGNEFMQYVDLAPYIDRYGLRPYELSFDIKSADITNRSSITAYFQNGSNTRYGGLSHGITATTDYVRHKVTFSPTNSNSTVSAAMLAFYGSYGTGNRPIVKNVTLKLAQ